MKKNATLFISVFLTLTSIAQTVPNGGFESWDTNTWTYYPTDWLTNNGQVQQDVFQDSASFEGILAMEVRPTITTLGSEGMARSVFDLEYIPPSLDFQVKYWRTITAAIGVEILFWNDSTIVYSNNWMPTDTLSDWMSVSIPLDQIEPIITHTEIRVWAFVGDFAPGDASISVDAMSFGTGNSIEEEQLIFGLSPNPVIDRLRIDTEERVTRLEVMDVCGKRIISQPFSNQLDVSGLAKGVYLLRLLGDDESESTQRFVKN